MLGSDEISCLKKSYASGILLLEEYFILCNGKRISSFLYLSEATSEANSIIALSGNISSTKKSFFKQ